MNFPDTAPDGLSAKHLLTTTQYLGTFSRTKGGLKFDQRRSFMQRQLWRVIPVFLLALTLAAMAGAAPINQDQASTQSAAKMARGELVKVDTDSQTFTIKQDNGEQAQFQYTADTKVEGSQTSMQGLATDTGSTVSVWYTESGASKIATRIEVTKK
jgi:hypothetical protein